MTATFEVLSAHGVDAARWQSLCDRLPVGVRDVMYTPAYYRTQEHGWSNAACAVYEWDDWFVMHPFLLRKIVTPVGVTDRFDMTSPYGFGGPVSNNDGFGSSRLWLWMEKDFEVWRRDHKVVSEYCALSPFAGKHQDHLLRESDVKIWDMAKQVATIRVDWPDEYILKSAHESRRQLLGRAVRDGLYVFHFQESPGLFSLSYDRHLDRIGAHPRWRRPDGYFQKYQMLMPERAAVLGVGGQRALVIVNGQVAHYHYACRDEKPPAGSGETLVMGACRWAARGGASWLNLGGGLTIAPDDSLWAYKSSWTPHRAPVRTYTRVFDDVAYVNLCADAGVSEGEKWFPAYRAKEAA